MIQFCYWILWRWTRAERGICIRADLLLENEGVFLIFLLKIENLMELCHPDGVKGKI